MLNKIANFQKRPGPVVLCIMDGIGYSDYTDGDAFKAANTPNLDYLHTVCPQNPLTAHGTLVGLPDDSDMGNSEVGHNAIGGGKIVAQGAKLVNNAISSKSLFEGVIWHKLVNQVIEKDSALHFIGLFSDGNVHSHINHLKSMIESAKDSGVKTVRIHALIDGRDVGETSALEYVLPFEEYMKDLREAGLDVKFASGGGRMKLTMDRYNAEWGMVEKGWNTHVHGIGRQFTSVAEAIETYRDETSVIDQNLPEFVIAEDGQPVGKIVDGDSVIFYNFRGDRSIEISQAFEDEEFTAFDRGARPDVEYAGMMEYDGDDHIPKQYLVDPPVIDNPMGLYLAESGISQFAISETQKFGHVTFFFNGNRSGKFDDSSETYCEIPSGILPFEERPWMKAAEITDEVLTQIQSGKQDFIRLNYANGDMVGHTGNFVAARMSVEAVDMQVGRLMHAVKAAQGTLVITADHGNCDEMYERNKKGEVAKNAKGIIKPKTSHTLNKVPFLVYDPAQVGDFQLKADFNGGLGNLAATCVNLLGYQTPEDFNESLISFK